MNESSVSRKWFIEIDVKHFEGATKSYFTYYSCVVIVLFDTASYRSAFTTVAFRKLVFHLSVLSLNQDIKICVIMRVEQSKNKECKTCYHIKSQL